LEEYTVNSNSMEKEELVKIRSPEGQYTHDHGPFRSESAFPYFTSKLEEVEPILTQIQGHELYNTHF
jgi:hypothetical protein